MAGRSPRRVGQGLGGPHSPNGFARQATSLTKSFCLLVRVFAKPRGPARPVARLRPQSSRIRRPARSASGCNVGLRPPQSRGRSGSVDEHRSDVTAFRESKRKDIGDIALTGTGPQGCSPATSSLAICCAGKCRHRYDRGRRFHGTARWNVGRSGVGNSAKRVRAIIALGRSAPGVRSDIRIGPVEEACLTQPRGAQQGGLWVRPCDTGHQDGSRCDRAILKDDPAVSRHEHSGCELGAEQQLMRRWTMIGWS